MSLRARLFVLCAAFLVAAASAATYGAVLVVRATDARHEHNELNMARVAARSLERNYGEQAASVRLYLLSGDAAALDRYNALRTEAGDLFGQLNGVLMGKELIDDIGQVRMAAREWRDSAIVPLISLRQQDQLEAVIAQYRDGAAVPSFRRVADDLSQLRARVGSAARSADVAESAARTDVTRFAVASVLGFIGLLGALAVLTRWWITRPLRRLSVAVRDTNEHSAPIPRRGAKELVRLADDVADLRGRMLDELDLAVRTREGLAQNAAVLMSVRAQLETSPDDLPSGWSVAAQLVPAVGIVAGDCYTVDIVGRDTMTIVVVDVAGHGASSAVLALRAKELLRAAVRSYDAPSDAVTWVSAQLTDLDDMFVTAFVARVDFNTGLVRFVNAGHPHAIVCDADHVVELAPTGPLIGPFAGSWTTREAIVGPGQMLVCYTDGVVEVRNESGEEFGLGRLHKVLRANYGEETEAIVKQCLAEVDAFSMGRAKDDLTLTVIARAARRS